MYAFGERWGPESHKADQYFGFVPGNGVHDIHMNQGLVRIVAALVNSKLSPEKEWVYLLNASDRTLTLAGWQLADKQKAKMPLSGTLEPGAMLRVDVQAPMVLSNKGGIITLLDQNGLKVHGVSYTKDQASRPGWTIVF